MTEQEAILTVIETITQMASEGRPLMMRVLPDGDVRVWDHYPEDDARDRLTRSRWYYHVHAPGERDPAEHGHFHLFLHRSQIDQDVTPLAQPEEGEEAPAQVAHIAALSIDQNGVPLSWFVTNRWVTDEFLFPADTVISHLDRYNVDNTDEDPLVNKLLTAMVRLYRTELTDLLRQRDIRLADISSDLGPAGFESGHDILATCSIDLDAKIEALDCDVASNG